MATSASPAHAATAAVLKRRSWLALVLGWPGLAQAGPGGPEAAAGDAPEPPPRPAVAWARQHIVRLAPPVAAHSWDDFKLQAAQRMVDSHPDTSYRGKPPEPLLGIPVIETELHADGRVRSTRVLREPLEAKETIAMALAVIRRAAPYGDVRHLPRPWTFVEVFLFDEQHRFMPATLDR